MAGGVRVRARWRSGLLLVACVLGVLGRSSPSGGEVRSPSRFVDPEGLAVCRATGTLFVADEDACELSALRPDGSTIARLEARADQPGGFITNGGSMTVVGPGRLLAIHGQELLEVELVGGKLRTGRVLGGRGSDLGRFLGLEGVDRDAEGRLYVSEEDSRRIQILTADGKPLRALPMPAEPEGIEVQGDLVWVTFAKDDWVGAFDVRTGEQMHRLGDWRQLDVPDAVCASDGLLYVSDQGHGRVVVFRPDGVAVRTIGEGELDSPEDLDVGPDGLLYVADSGNQRIAVFRRTGELVRSIR